MSELNIDERDELKARELNEKPSMHACLYSIQ